MSESQRIEQNFETPPRDEIPAISRGHVAAMEQSDDDAVWIIGGGQHMVVLRVIGRRSGNEQKVALPFWRDPEGHRIVVASFSGAPQHPDWFLNLQDRGANPEVLCRVQGGQFWSRAEILDGDDYTTTWAALTADRAWYIEYQTKTERRIPLVRLPETRPA